MAKTYSFLRDGNDESKKTKGTKKCVIKIYKHQIKICKICNCLQASQLENKINYLEKIKLM